MADEVETFLKYALERSKEINVNILTWAGGFRVKTANFVSFFYRQFPKETCNLVRISIYRVWPIAQSL